MSVFIGGVNGNAVVSASDGRRGKGQSGASERDRGQLL